MGPRLGVPPEIRAQFISPAVGAFAIFAALGFYSALIPNLLSQSLHNNSHAAAGAVVAELFLTGAVAVVLTARLKARLGFLLGLASLLPGLGVLVAAEAFHSMATLLASTVVSGIATGLGYRYSLQLLNEIAPEDQRAEVVSSYLIACYGGIALPVIGVDLLAGAMKAENADAIFAVIIAALALAALVTELMTRNDKSAATPSRR
jgi:MFS family permease